MEHSPPSSEIEEDEDEPLAEAAAPHQLSGLEKFRQMARNPESVEQINLGAGRVVNLEKLPEVEIPTDDEETEEQDQGPRRSSRPRSKPGHLKDFV